MIKPKSLKKGDTVGVVATSEPILEEAKEDIEKSVSRMKELGINVKFGKYAFSNPLGYRRNGKA